MKKFALIAIIGVLFLSLINFKPVIADTKAASPLKDVAGHWAEKSILQAVQKGYVEGYPDGTFKPEGKVTRAELIKMVVSAMKLDPGPAGDHWYDTYVNAAISAQIYKYDFTGDLSNAMTRQELAMIAVRATREDIKTAKTFELNRFMYEATKSGIVMGLGNGELGTDQTTTRAQAVAIIERILTLNSGEKLPTDKHAISRAEVAWHKTNVFTMLPRYFPEIDPVLNNSNLLKWDPDKIRYQSKDGNYHEELERFVVVDMADPNDPFKPDAEGLKFGVDYYDPDNNEKYTEHVISPPSNSYLEVTVMKQHYNHPYNAPKENGLMQLTWHSLIKIDGDGDAGLASQWSGISKVQANYEFYMNGVIKNADIEPDLNNLFDLNMVHGLPKYYKDMPANGGDYFSYNAAILPYGDLVPPKTSNFTKIINISYLPNSQLTSYLGEMQWISVYSGHTDLSISNKQ